MGALKHVARRMNKKPERIFNADESSVQMNARDVNVVFEKLTK
jgi:hypothetical protein